MAKRFESSKGKWNDPFQLNRLWCALFRWIMRVMLLWPVFLPYAAFADNLRPAYLEIEELASGNIRVVWKIPRGQEISSGFEPSFPAQFRMIPPKKRLMTNDAIVETWNMRSEDQRLAGAQIRIDALKKSTTDALVRVRFYDGSVHRVVLRPTETTATIPYPDKSINGPNRFYTPLLQFIDHWRYALLFLAAFALSLLPLARRRGILLCTAALVTGALCGQAIGQLPSYDKFFQADIPSRTETAKILHGLMLNTYRAFMLQKDEDIYDTLARSVSDQFLTEVYLQNRENMQMSDSDGTMAIIHQLDIKSIDSLAQKTDGSIGMVARWDVYGSVHHQKHVHYRCNTYQANVRIKPTENYWKLVEIRLLDEQRVL